MDLLKQKVGLADIDTIHEELTGLLEVAASAQNSDFRALYNDIVKHTEAHFQHEEQLMRETHFIHSSEHIGEHRQMLNEMRQFGRRPLPMARAYLQQRLPERFSLHIARMDSLLAAYLRTDK